MSLDFNRMPSSLLLLCWLLFGSFSIQANASPVEEEALRHIRQLRAIKAGGGQAIDANNKAMDAAWKFFNSNKNAVLPILKRELSLELKKGKPSNLVLLDIGYFIGLQNESGDKELVRQALFALDAGDEVVRADQQELFLLAHVVASSGHDEQLLAFIDKTFLRDTVSVFIPQHALRLDPTLVCVFLYGLQGEAAENHLKGLLKEKAVAQKVIEVLIWIGSPASTQFVNDAMLAYADYETFVRAVAFMMKAGGPAGREALLSLDANKLDKRSREYFGKIRKDVESVNFEQLRKQFDGMSGAAKINEEELKQRLHTMYENFGKDDTLNPSAVLNSGLPREFVVNELKRIRERTFNRISDEALGDIEMTNALLNALYYRNK